MNVEDTDQCIVMAGSGSGSWWSLTGLCRLVLLELALFTHMADPSNYCWYRHESYDVMKQEYCENGCCSDHGQKEDICCFKCSSGIPSLRSIGIIIGIILAGVAVLSTIVIIIICCYSAKRKRENRTGNIISTRPSASVIYTASAGYTIPHPPSAFYPSSQFPNAAPAVPPPYDEDAPSQQKTNHVVFSNTPYMNAGVS